MKLKSDGNKNYPRILETLTGIKGTDVQYAITIEDIDLTIAHYKRMILWAKNENPNSFVTIDIMEEAIGENWYSRHCPICCKIKKHVKDIDWKFSPCVLCPFDLKEISDVLDPEEMPCLDEWRKLTGSRTWGHWLKQAEAILEGLKSIRKELLLKESKKSKEE